MIADLPKHATLRAHPELRAHLRQRIDEEKRIRLSGASGKRCKRCGCEHDLHTRGCKRCWERHRQRARWKEDAAFRAANAAYKRKQYKAKRAA